VGPACPLSSEIRLGGRGREASEDMTSTSITSSWIAITKVFEGFMQIHIQCVSLSSEFWIVLSLNSKLFLTPLKEYL